MANHLRKMMNQIVQLPNAALKVRLEFQDPDVFKSTSHCDLCDLFLTSFTLLLSLIYSSLYLTYHNVNWNKLELEEHSAAGENTELCSATASCPDLRAITVMFA